MQRSLRRETTEQADEQRSTVPPYIRTQPSCVSAIPYKKGIERIVLPRSGKCTLCFHAIKLFVGRYDPVKKKMVHQDKKGSVICFHLVLGIWLEGVAQR